MPLPLDTLILGGGACGLWLLDDLTRRGYAALLLESSALGAGQTVASQGIIHGGLKYSLAGLVTDSADAIKHLPALWRDCLAGRAQPDLSSTKIRSDFCHLWSTDSIMSRLGKLGASLALQVKPVSLPREQWPALLRDCTGSVSQLDEQVISPPSFIAALAQHHRDRILKIDANVGVKFITSSPGHISEVHCTDPTTGTSVNLQPTTIIFTAGQGNEMLRQRAGLSTLAMQRRPLHVCMARGPLPPFNGHCIDGSKTRITITSDVDFQGRTIWQLGGQVSEDGVKMDRAQLIEHVQRELLAVLPALRENDLAQVEWATYRIDRAEGANRHGQRPAHAVVLTEGNVLTCWPTKLVLVPQAVAQIVRQLPEPSHALDMKQFSDWAKPAVALPPWEMSFA